MAAKSTDPDTPPKPKARSDAYTGMLLLSLLVLIGACALIFLDYSQYPSAKPPAAQRTSVIGNPQAEGADQQPPADTAKGKKK
jgi:hypothetical protein